MKIHSSGRNIAQRGVVLVSSLLLLIVVTIIALSMFRSFGIQEKIAGNVREKQRALQAALSAESFAENWLALNSSTTAPAPCSNLLNGNIGQGQICSNALTGVPTPAVADVTVVPWQIGGAPVGVSYLPPSMAISTTTSVSAANVTNPTYYGTPAFYISDMGPSADPTFPGGEVYQIDAAGYGGNSNTVAEVESTYVVYTTSKTD
jgi:type IV pilus assembly protein PilX